MVAALCLKANTLAAARIVVMDVLGNELIGVVMMVITDKDRER